MSISQGQKILASDMSKILTTDNFLNNIDLEALKTALGVTAGGGDKIVGGVKSISGKVITLTTSNWDYAQIISYPPSIIRTDAKINYQDFYGYGMEDAPVESIILKGSTALVPVWIMSSYVLITNETITASGNTLTFSGNNATNGRFSVILYKQT